MDKTGVIAGQCACGDLDVAGAPFQILFERERNGQAT